MATLRYTYCAALIAVAVIARSPAHAQPYISEIRIDQPGTDRDEYFEVLGDPFSSLADLTYIVIGDNSTGSGVIESVTSLNDHVIPDDGYFLATESSFSLNGQPDATATLAFENGDNVTHALVRDFAGSIGDDLDLDNDGILESEPWSQVVDCVALIDDENGGDTTYCQTRIGPDTTGVPWHAYLDGGWKIGPGDPAVGVDTPGKAAAILPVELLSFKAIFDGNAIILRWTTAAEHLNAGFVVEQVLDESVRDIAFVASAGQPADYMWNDPAPPPGLHIYRLRQLDVDGANRVIAMTSVEVTYPDLGVLAPIYPNPMLSSATFQASTSVSQFARIGLFDARGRQLRELFAGRIPAGHRIRGLIRNAGLAPGVYYVRFAGERDDEARSLVVLK